MVNSTEYWILRRFFPASSLGAPDTSYASRSKIATLLGDGFMDLIRDKVVLDFGCGEGSEAVGIAANGARQVLGLDIREEVLRKGREKAAAAGVEDSCIFATTFQDRTADLIISLDAFEHFADPAAVLRKMYALLKPGGEVFMGFGPIWRHPLGGHGFSVFPWAHLIFSEKALIRWRADFKNDGATRFGDIAGGLNQMTIRRFEGLIASSPFQCADLDLRPIRSLRLLHNRLTREFLTAVVRCRLVAKSEGTP